MWVEVVGDPTPTAVLVALLLGRVDVNFRPERVQVRCTRQSVVPPFERRLELVCLVASHRGSEHVDGSSSVNKSVDEEH